MRPKKVIEIFCKNKKEFFKAQNIAFNRGFFWNNKVNCSDREPIDMKIIEDQNYYLILFIYEKRLFMSPSLYNIEKLKSFNVIIEPDINAEKDLISINFIDMSNKLSEIFGIY
jgi:hypothetical protein